MAMYFVFAGAFVGAFVSAFVGAFVRPLTCFGRLRMGSERRLSDAILNTNQRTEWREPHHRDFT